jgi:hypothetical protein
MPGGRAPGASTVDPVVGGPTLPRLRGSQPLAGQVNDRRTDQNAAAITPLKAVTWLTGAIRSLRQDGQRRARVSGSRGSGGAMGRHPSMGSTAVKSRVPDTSDAPRRAVDSRG